MARAPAGAGRGDPEGPGRREPVVLHRRRRHQHDAQQRPHPDQPQAARRRGTAPRRGSSAACSTETARVSGITLYHAAGAGSDDRRPRQPRPNTSSRSRDATPTTCRSLGRRGWWRGCRALPEARRRGERPAAERACRPTSRSTATTAARFGITPATIDNALYDAFGQRIISTIFTQSNQYRVILEADPGDAALGRTR